MNPALVEKIRAIERRRVGHGHTGQQPNEVFSAGWAEVDAALGGGLPRGGLHEWFGLAPADASRDSTRHWRPPVGVFLHLARRAREACESSRWTVWIGRKCFPYPAVLRRGIADQTFLQQSLFVAPRSPADRLWAVDLALRSPAVGVVVADGSDLDMAATRRVQLAAKNHASTVLFARPPWEQVEPSAAHTRWLVRNVATNDGDAGGVNPAWMIELLRCKGLHWGAAANVWRVEWDRVECTLRLSAPLADPTGAATAPSTVVRRGERIRRLPA